MQSQAAIHFSICVSNPLIWWIRQKSLRCLATTCSSSNFQTVNAEVFIHLKCASEVSEQGIVMLQIPVYSVSCMDLPLTSCMVPTLTGPFHLKDCRMDCGAWFLSHDGWGDGVERAAERGWWSRAACRGKDCALQEGAGVAPPSNPPSGSSLRSWTPGEDVEQL